MRLAADPDAIVRLEQESTNAKRFSQGFGEVNLKDSKAALIGLNTCFDESSEVVARESSSSKVDWISGILTIVS